MTAIQPILPRLARPTRKVEFAAPRPSSIIPIPWNVLHGHSTAAASDSKIEISFRLSRIWTSSPHDKQFAMAAAAETTGIKCRAPLPISPVRYCHGNYIPWCSWADTLVLPMIHLLKPSAASVHSHRTSHIQPKSGSTIHLSNAVTSSVLARSRASRRGPVQSTRPGLPALSMLCRILHTPSGVSQSD